MAVDRQALLEAILKRNAVRRQAFLPLLDVRLSTTVTTALAILAIAAGVLILIRR